MVYGLEATVTLSLGGVDTEFFTSANIQAAIAEADRYVDKINSNASAETKTICSNRIAKNIMLDGRNNHILKGLHSDGGRAGSSGKSRLTFNVMVDDETMEMLEEMPDVNIQVDNKPNEAGDV